MPNETNQRPKRSGRKIGRVRIGFNVLAQILLVLFLAAMVNSIAFKHYARWDFSRDQKYALSDKTKRFLDTLKSKMRITIFFPPSTPISTDVQNLLTEYQYAGKGKVDIEHIDPERNLSRAKELFDKYKVVTDEPLLIVDSKDAIRLSKRPRWLRSIRAGWRWAKALAWPHSRASKPSPAP